MPDAYKVVSTLGLDELNQAAIKANYNRQLSPEFMDSVSPNKEHVVESLMIHEHAAGIRVDPHYRCRVIVMTGHGMREAFLDVSFADYNALETLEVGPHASH